MMAETTRPNKQSFEAIKKLLLPLIGNHNEREAFVNSALYECPVLDQIDWSGASGVFTTNLLHKLLKFGECEPGHPAIVMLLEEVRLNSGVDKYAQIDRLIQIYTPEPAIPTETLSEELYYDDQYIWSEVDAEIKALETAVLPQPFAWIDIPAGKVTLQKREGEDYVPWTGQEFDVPAFAISKYPITNAQFSEFIEEGGYKQPHLWTGGGWSQIRFRERVAPNYHPRQESWIDTLKNKPDHPLVGISWYEAMAFCEFLKEVTGESISLPTEQMWQRAAQGDSNWKYPWGMRWVANLCNSNVDQSQEEASSADTTCVSEYEQKGDSPYGVVDMIGNVWEWCLTSSTGSNSLDLSTKDERARIIRGGSYNENDRNRLQAIYRITRFADTDHEYIGFRIARSL